MRPLRLARVAMEAESLRFHLRMRRLAFRIVFATLAIAVLLLAVVFLHLAAWYRLRVELPPHWVALIFAGVDLLLAAITASFAVRSKPGAVEREALALRRKALDDVALSLSFSAILARIVSAVMTARARR